MLKLGIGIVVYNQIIEESEAYKSLRRNDVPAGMIVKFIILDNSEKEEVRKDNGVCSGKSTDIIYVDMEGNKGLSHAYNRLFGIVEEEALDWAVTSDQDTTYPKDYIRNLFFRLNNKDCVIAPVVYCDTGIISPYTGAFDGLLQRKYFINSGLAYSSGLIKKGIRFNGNLFIDYIDNDMINSLYQDETVIIETSTTLRQDFSGTAKTGKETALKRFQLFAKDSETYAKSWPQTKMYTMFCLTKRAAKLSLMYKDLIFMKALVKK